MTIKLNARQKSALRQIKSFNGDFSVFWMVKSREYLVDNGLAIVTGERVKLTAEGEAAVKELE